MAKSRKILKFRQAVRLHVATNDLEMAQQRWFQQHSEQLRALVRMSDLSDLKLLSRVTRSNEDDKC